LQVTHPYTPVDETDMIVLVAAQPHWLVVLDQDRAADAQLQVVLLFLLAA
jgi:hypothetical protein